MPSQTLKEPSGKYVVAAEIKLGSLAKFEAAIGEMGKVLQLNRTVWLLESGRSLGTVRNDLTPHMDPSDTLVIVEVGSGRRAWSNLGMGLEAQVRTFWRAPAQGEGTAAVATAAGD